MSGSRSSLVAAKCLANNGERRAEMGLSDWGWASAGEGCGESARCPLAARGCEIVGSGANEWAPAGGQAGRRAGGSVGLSPGSTGRQAGKQAAAKAALKVWRPSRASFAGRFDFCEHSLVVEVVASSPLSRARSRSWRS